MSFPHVVGQSFSARAYKISNEGLQVSGKFIFEDGKKLYVRGVTYGTFSTDLNGTGYPSPDLVGSDFALMADHGINAVRTYTVPPNYVLDTAHRHGLRIMVGLPWEQHIAFLNEKGRAWSIIDRVREGVRACTGHPAVLCYAIGNEIPTSIVRWHGRRRIERFIKKLYQAAKAEDPAGLVTYVNYPSTEYLDLPFLDFLCFNVYLESQERLEAYIARLQNLAGERPLVMGEIGLDSRRHGGDFQAQTLGWQIRTAFAAGCAGAFVFSWTDEWYRGGHNIEDWDFGLTDRKRKPKPALTAVNEAFAGVPAPAVYQWPRISVVVCSYNGGKTIRECLEGLCELQYPNYEVIVVDDGSTDNTAAIASEYPFKLIRTENRGLSSARNSGMEAATGEIIAYTDDDARPDPHWLMYLATTFISTEHAAVGGPNIPPQGDGLIAECVAHSPGGPAHVLLSDRVAEHVPGCNLAVRRSALQAIGGFDPQFRVAGDDVDVCWRLQQRGWTIGFHPAAIVWHHRRSSVCAYWRQQKGYGEAESLLEKKWPKKYNSLGHISWLGRIYDKGVTRMLRLARERIYQGTWGSAPFQFASQAAPGRLSSLILMPEWYLIIIALVALSALSALWAPLMIHIPLLILAAGGPLMQSILSAAKAPFAGAPRSRLTRVKLFSLTALLHLLQPLARLWGRQRHGLTPWRNRAAKGFVLPWSRTSVLWSERWQSAEDRLQSVELALQVEGASVMRGGDYDSWDLEVQGGVLGATRTLMSIEEHGAGKQLVRFRGWPKPSSKGMVIIGLFSSLSVGAAFDGAWLAAAALGAGALLLILRTVQECAASMSIILSVLQTTALGSKRMSLKRLRTVLATLHYVPRPIHRYLRRVQALGRKRRRELSATSIPSYTNRSSQPEQVEAEPEKGKSKSARA